MMTILFYDYDSVSFTQVFLDLCSTAIRTDSRRRGFANRRQRLKTVTAVALH